jgi:hypothetical protein
MVRKCPVIVGKSCLQLTSTSTGGDAIESIMRALDLSGNSGNNPTAAAPGFEPKSGNIWNNNSGAFHPEQGYHGERSAMPGEGMYERGWNGSQEYNTPPEGQAYMMPRSYENQGGPCPMAKNGSGFIPPMGKMNQYLPEFGGAGQFNGYDISYAPPRNDGQIGRTGSYSNVTHAAAEQGPAAAPNRDQSVSVPILDANDYFSAPDNGSNQDDSPTSSPNRERRPRPTGEHNRGPSSANSLNEPLMMWSMENAEEQAAVGEGPTVFDEVTPADDAWVYYEIEFKRGRAAVFRCGNDNVDMGAYVIVEADRGKDLGRTKRILNQEALDRFGERLPKRALLRYAHPVEIQQLKQKADEESKAVNVCLRKTKQRRLPMMVRDAEYQFDRNKLVFYFTADHRIDFRELVRDLFAVYKTRIWMQQISTQNS